MALRQAPNFIFFPFFVCVCVCVPKIKCILIDSYEHSLEIGHVSPTQKRGIITLIHKGKNLPRERLANWRPITLLNTDYKILAKALARRLNKVITKLIAND